MARRREFDEADVIERAMHAFWSHGYRSTTPQMLVQATGLSRSSLYATFDSKHGLFLAALDLYVEGQAAVMRELLAGGTLREGLERLYREMIALATAPDEPRYCLVCSSSLEVPDDDGPTLDRLARAQASLVDVFQARFQQAIDEGELPADADPLALARFVVNTNMGLQVTARANPDPVVLGQIAAQAVDAVC